MAQHIGPAIDRVDGRDKVTGRARYAVEHPLANAAHAVLIVSTIARGRVTAMDTSLAARVPGMLAIMTPMNAPRLRPAGQSERSAKRELTLLQDDRVRYAGQPIGVVVAETLEDATEAATLVRVRYAPEPHEVTLERAAARLHTPKEAGRPDQPADERRGDVERGLAEAEVRIEHVYTTPFEAHNPMEPHATTAAWDGPRRLLLYDATQGVFGCRSRVAELLGLDPGDVRVLTPYLGGGFGSKGPTWSHVVLAAMAAREVRRPVKLALTRPQMFGPVGQRSQTRQTIALGARRDGTLTALRHDTLAHTSTFDEFMEAAGTASAMLYAVPNAAISHRLVRSDVGTPSYMRAPGWAPGTFALECAMDEMAVALEMDPLEFRLKNYAERDPRKPRPWSLKSLRECYRIGAERFGWSGRPPRPATLRDGRERIGWGMATSVYPTHRSPAGAIARLQPDGTVLILSGTQDIGTGTYTIMTQLAAEALGLPPARVAFRLGDTEFPQTPVSGGSQTAASAGSAVHAAATALRERLIRAAVTDARSPLSGLTVDDVTLEDGRLVARRDPARGETLVALATRHRDAVIEARSELSPGDEEERWAMYAFGAQFAEVRVDVDLGLVRVTRMVGAFDVGRVLNAKTARSQMSGGMVWGIAMALHEATRYDRALGRPVNNNLAEYHVPVNADVPAIDVTFVDAVDPHANPIGVKGIGELGITGAPAAVANAIYHATGQRVRDLPITLDRLL
jgi:xanthine dehydrogenase YagR molybdenum-binding subunit